MHKMTGFEWNKLRVTESPCAPYAVDMSLLKRFAVSPLPVPPGWYALPLRLIAGYGFLEHGYAKLARGPEHFAAILHAIGMPFPDLLSWATVGVEIGGGLMILAGALVPLTAVPMIAVLGVAILTVHLPNGFSSIKLIAYDASGAHFGQPGYETDLLYMAVVVALSIAGAGPCSVDRYLRSRWQPVGPSGDQ
jgi:putative oxidoreductase